MLDPRLRQAISGGASSGWWESLFKLVITDIRKSACIKKEIETMTRRQRSTQENISIRNMYNIPCVMPKMVQCYIYHTTRSSCILHRHTAYAYYYVLLHIQVCPPTFSRHISNTFIRRHRVVSFQQRHHRLQKRNKNKNAHHHLCSADADANAVTISLMLICLNATCFLMMWSILGDIEDFRCTSMAQYNQYYWRFLIAFIEI